MSSMNINSVSNKSPIPLKILLEAARNGVSRKASVYLLYTGDAGLEKRGCDNAMCNQRDAID